MKKHKENVFAQKFHLLSSQKSEEINWSSSESSDYENISTNADKVCNFRKTTSRKRKRKQSVRKNISNLDITVIDIPKDRKDSTSKKKPLISSEISVIESSGSKSPILGSTQYFQPYKCSNVSTSPIISSKSFEYQSKLRKSSISPILVLKTASPRLSPTAKKKLFKHDSSTTRDGIMSNPKIIKQNYCLDRRKSLNNLNEHIETNKHQLNTNLKIKITNEDLDNKKCVLSNSSNSFSVKLSAINKTFVVRKEITSSDDLKPKIEGLSQEICVINETPDINMDDSMAMLKTSSLELVKKVKNYFDNQFSTETPSQQTISEISTQKNSSKTSDDIEIVNITTQVLSNKNSIESIKESDLLIENDKKEKKIRYKKDGLAYRLNNLLKKQTASISLWLHERYLAENSNFVLPKKEFLALRICKVNFKYGCHLLEGMDLYDDYYLVLINSCHCSDNILTDSIIKLYDPYTKVDFQQNCKLIVNVTKFECVNVKN